jgi:hypothetical protein
VRLDWPLRDPQSPRDRGLAAVMPVAWSSDFGGLHLGIRTRWSYLGRLRRSTSFVTWAFGDGPGNFPDRLHAYARSTAALRPGTEATLAWWRVEGLAGAALGVDRSLRARRTQSADPHVGFDAMWMATTDLGYLDPLRWDHAGTVEFGPWAATTVHRDSATWRARAGLRGGIVYRYPGSGLASAARYDVEGFARATLEASVRRPGPAGLELGARAFAGGYVAEHAPSRQRRIHVAGADPYQTFANPLLRSRGALLVRPEFQYHGPGQGNLRGFRPDLGGRWVLSVNVEAARPLFARASGVARKLGVTAFADAGLVDAAALPTFPAGTGVATLYDAGVGLHAVLELGDLGWTTRFELPLLVSRSAFAADPAGRAGRLALRWQVSLEPSF